MFLLKTRHLTASDICGQIEVYMNVLRLSDKAMYPNDFVIDFFTKYTANLNAYSNAYSITKYLKLVRFIEKLKNSYYKTI